MTGLHDEFVAWAKGRNDVLGSPFTSWLLARRNPDGTAERDAAGHQLFETQAEYLSRQATHITTLAQDTTPEQMGLFA